MVFKFIISICTVQHVTRTVPHVNNPAQKYRSPFDKLRANGFIIMII